MSEVKREKPHFELARIYQDGSQEIEQIELYNLENVLKKGSNLKMVRRGFLGLSALSSGALVAAFRGLSSSPSLTPNLTLTGHAARHGLDLRTGPALAYPLLRTLPGGTQFTILARNKKATWLKVQTHDGNTGWGPRAMMIVSKPDAISSLPVPNNIPPPPAPAPNVEPNTIPGGGGGGSCDPKHDPNCICTCNQICICIPVG